MDIKRLLLALALSFVFIITWNVFFPPLEEAQENKSPQKTQTFQSELIQKENKAPMIVENIQPSAAPTIISTPLTRLQLGNGATSIQNLKIIEKKNEEAQAQITKEMEASDKLKQKEDIQTKQKIDWKEPK